MNLEPNLLERLNQVSPPGIKFLQLWEKQINVASIVTSATYQVNCNGLGKVASQVLQPDYAITYEEKGNPTTKVVADKILDMQIVDDVLYRTIL